MSFNTTPLARRLGDRNREIQQMQFDAANPADAAARIEFDPISERKTIHATAQMRLAALQVAFSMAAMIHESEDDELLPSEVLDGLMLEVFSDDDDDSDGIEPLIKAEFSAHVSDACSSLGVEDDIIDDMFDDDVDVADAAIESAAEVIFENMPDDDDLDDFIESFAYGHEDDMAFDSVEDDDNLQFDAARKTLRPGKKTVKKVNGRTVTYKAVRAMRTKDGKPTMVVVNKRVGDSHIVLSSGQKAALKKARMKSKTASAIKKRMRSYAKGLGQGIYKLPTATAKKMQASLMAGHYKRSTS